MVPVAASRAGYPGLMGKEQGSRGYGNMEVIKATHMVDVFHSAPQVRNGLKPS